MENYSNQIQAKLMSAAVTLYEVDEYRLSMDVLERIFSLHEDYVPAYILCGVIFQNLGKLDESEKAYQKALELDPENFQVLQGLGKLHLNSGKYLSALDYFSRCYEKKPENVNIVQDIVLCLTKIGGREKQIAEYLGDAWRKTNNIDIGIQYARHLLMKLDQPEKANKILEVIIRVKKTTRVLAELALTQYALGHIDRSIEYLEQALEKDPQFSRAWRGLAQCYTALGKLQDANAAVEEALAIEPDHYRNWQAKADILLELHKYDKAYEASQQGIDQIDLREEPDAAPVLAALYLQRFHASLGEGRIETALNEMQVARSLLPNDLRLYLYPIQLLRRMEQYGQALEVIEKALENNTLNQNPVIHFELLKTLLIDGDFDRVEKVIGEILKRFGETAFDALIDILVKHYIDDKPKLAIGFAAILYKFQKQNPRLNTCYAYMVLPDDSARAKTLLRQVIKAENQNVYTCLAMANLAYLEALSGEYDTALSHVQGILSSEYTEEFVFLRVPIWFNNRMESDPNRVPGRSIALGKAAHAYIISLNLAKGKVSQAVKSYEALKEQSEPPSSLLLILEASISLAAEKLKEAGDKLNQAMDLSDNEIEQEELAVWINSL